MGLKGDCSHHHKLSMKNIAALLLAVRPWVSWVRTAPQWPWALQVGPLRLEHCCSEGGAGGAAPGRGPHSPSHIKDDWEKEQKLLPCQLVLQQMPRSLHSGAQAPPHVGCQSLFKWGLSSEARLWSHRLCRWGPGSAPGRCSLSLCSHRLSPRDADKQTSESAVASNPYSRPWNCGKVVLT